MNIIFKHTMKNIFGKPVRTFVVTFSIFLCALCAMLCFDLLQELKQQFISLYSATFGNADILLYDPIDLPPEAPEHASLGVACDVTYFYKDLEGEYNYAHGQAVQLYSFSFETAAIMGVYDDYVPADGEVILSSRFARDFGYEAGDPIELLDANDNCHEMTVAYILPGDNNNLFASGYSAVMNHNSMLEFKGGTDFMPTLSFIDVPDASQIDDMIDVIENVSPGASYENVANNEELNEMMEQATSILFLLFAIAILLVVFVTISICDKIISERMSVVGTLRSLGLSNRRTAGVLLFENVIYALMGSVPALLIYCLIRTPIMTSMFSVTNSYGESVEVAIHPVSIPLIIAVIGASILAECLLPLKAVLGATRMPIRDIIFDNRDTAYVLKKRSVILGCIFLVASVVLGIFHKNMFCVVGFVVTTVVALALLTPILIIGVSCGLQTLFEKTGDMPRVLAAREMRARKSTVGSAVLCATSAAICVTILAFGLDMIGDFTPPEYDCNVIVDVMYDADSLSYIENLEGVSAVEYHYENYMTLMVNGEEDNVSTVQGMPDGGFQMLREYSGLPQRLESGTVAIRAEYAKKHHLSVGDTLCLTIDPEGIFPLDQEFQIACLYDVTGGYKSDNVFIIGLEDFTDLFGDDPTNIFIRCDDPQRIVETIKKYSSMNTGYYTMTVEDYLAETSEETNPVVIGLMVLILIGTGMTCIGIASNQIIGFEGRKRECAVMLSTSMDKKQLSGVLFREVLFSSIVSSVAGCIFGMVLIQAIRSAFDDMGSPLGGGTNVLPVVIFTAVLAVVFTLTVLFPIGHLRKMQLSEQLKYE